MTIESPSVYEAIGCLISIGSLICTIVLYRLSSKSTKNNINDCISKCKSMIKEVLKSRKYETYRTVLMKHLQIAEIKNDPNLYTKAWLLARYDDGFLFDLMKKEGICDFDSYLEFLLEEFKNDKKVVDNIHCLQTLIRPNKNKEMKKIKIDGWDD